MGNTGSSGNGGSSSGRRRSHSHHQHQPHHPQQPPASPPQPPAQQQEATAMANRYVFAAVTPYPPQYPNPNPPQYYQYGGYYPPPPAVPMPLPSPFEYPSSHPPGWVTGGRYPIPYAPPPSMPAPYVEHQKAVTIRNDVNIKKETLRIEPDDENPGKHLVSFTFDATLAGSITVFFFAKEGLDCNLIATREDRLTPAVVSFGKGLGQKFKQPPGTGIDFSTFDESELLKEGEQEVYPLAIKAEASTSTDQGSVGDNQKSVIPNAQITQALFEKKENGEYKVRAVKQILWVNGTRYELQEIYGIGNAIDTDADGSDPGKECVICLSEPRDTTVLPCRHMCMCSECAKVLRFQTNRCPICRQPVERLLEIKVNNRAEEQREA